MSGADERPRPQYGEYATPEEQQAAIKQPDPWTAGTVPGAPPAASAPVPSVSPATPTAAEATRPRGDRFVTIVLLGIGLFNVITTVVAYGDVRGVFEGALAMLGMAGDFSNWETAQQMAWLASGSLVVVWVLTAWWAFRTIRLGRLSWWIPVVGAVVGYLVAAVFIGIALASDPAFLDSIPGV